MKSLSEMTLAELWELFPIILKKHNPEYERTVTFYDNPSEVYATRQTYQNYYARRTR
ncbi:hypothetical protein FACS1894105_07850 [Clostridia bacterium]|nr:hypothetical protein FACS1894105_07850 [Clostridia bacterium]